MAEAALRCGRVVLRRLPPPDRWEHAWDPACVAVVRGEGAPLADALARALEAEGWRVVRVDAADDADPEAQLAAVEAEGPIAAWIEVFAPVAPVGDGLDSPAEEARLFACFERASRLGSRLSAPDLTRAWFAVVTRVDGGLGRAEDALRGGVLTAGVYGLVKTLAHEWPAVCCRVVDLHPALPEEVGAACVVAELLDAERALVEVAHGPQGRRTLVVEEVRGE